MGDEFAADGEVEDGLAELFEVARAGGQVVEGAWLAVEKPGGSFAEGVGVFGYVLPPVVLAFGVLVVLDRPGTEVGRIVIGTVLITTRSRCQIGPR